MDQTMNMTDNRCDASLNLAASLLICAALVAGVCLPRGASAQDYAAIVAESDRSDADRQTDRRRKPAELLAFARIKTGMKVLDMGAGGGYSTELIARTVGPTGKVYAQDGPEPNERAKAAFDARNAKAVMKEVVRLVRNFDDPLPTDVGDFDVITFFFYYHDTTYMPVDRVVMNKRLLAALKPGGLLVIADHAARAGDGATVGKLLHRVEESTLKTEIEAAGFKLLASGEFLRNPQDPRDKPVFRPEQPVDEFLLLFERPR
jgi:predicted methyltransferase